MKCRTAIRELSLSMDGRKRQGELGELQQHLSRCPECALRAHRLGKLKGSLGELPRRTVPRELTAALRVIASRERLRRLRHASLEPALEHWGGLVRVWMGNLMRPLALPFAGGLVSALVLFNMLAPMYANHDRYLVADVPTVLVTTAGLKSSLAFGLSGDDIEVVVLVDDQGRMIDYSIPPGQSVNPALRRCIMNTLVCTQFTPATVFGQPRSGELRIKLRYNQIEVKG